MTLGEYISTYRAEHKESLRSFSRRAELSPTYISYLEKGETQRGLKPVASIETYRNIAKAVGLSLDELIRAVDDDVALNASGTLSAKSLVAEKDAMSKKLEQHLSASRNRRKLLSMVDDMSEEELLKIIKIIEAIKGK